MATRRVRAVDLEQASAVCMASFMEAVAPSLGPEGIATFAGIVSVDGFAGRLSDENDMFVYEADGQVVGVAELMGGQHVATLFVAPGWQGQGIGRALMDALLDCARAEVVTVRASLTAVAAYQRYGFVVSGPVGEYAGLVYQPMQKPLSGRDPGFTAAALCSAEIHRVQAVLQEQEEDTPKWRIYEALLQATPDLSYVFDLDHRFIYANKALLSMWGMTWDEAMGKTCLEIGYEPWHAAMHDAEIDRVIATKQPIRGDVPFPHATEGVRIYDYIFTPVIGPDGEVAAIAGSTRDVTERKRHEQHLQLLINELNHRVKNSLAMVQSIARQTFRNAQDVAEASEKVEQRLMALAAAHDVLTRENWHSADIVELIQATATVHADDRDQRFDIKGEPCRLEPRRALALAMALHELGTNAVKYGALSGAEGRVSLQWDKHKVAGRDMIELVWQESGGPPVQSPSQRGFGSRLLEQGLKHDLGGKVELDFDPDGLRYRVLFPPLDDDMRVHP